MILHQQLFLFVKEELFIIQVQPELLWQMQQELLRLEAAFCLEQFSFILEAAQLVSVTEFFPFYLVRGSLY